MQTKRTNKIPKIGNMGFKRIKHSSQQNLQSCTLSIVHHPHSVIVQTCQILCWIDFASLSPKLINSLVLLILWVCCKTCQILGSFDVATLLTKLAKSEWTYHWWNRTQDCHGQSNCSNKEVSPKVKGSTPFPITKQHYNQRSMSFHFIFLFSLETLHLYCTMLFSFIDYLWFHSSICFDACFNFQCINCHYQLVLVSSHSSIYYRSIKRQCL